MALGSIGGRRMMQLGLSVGNKGFFFFFFLVLDLEGETTRGSAQGCVGRRFGGFFQHRCVSVE